MSIQRYLMLYPTPPHLGALASSVQGVQYFESTACLLVPSALFADYAKGLLPATPSDADLALYASITEFHGTPKHTIPLTSKAATVATKQQHRERQHHYLIQRDLLELAIVQALFQLAWRCISEPVKFAYKTCSNAVNWLANRLSKSQQYRTGKSQTKNYQ
jgi:hypothetical protein